MLQQEELKRLGENVRRLRKARGMNQTSLANHAKTRPTTISSIEKGNNPNPGWDLLNRIAKVLNTTIHELTVPGAPLGERKNPEDIPEGLADLMTHQNTLLAMWEPRISTEEFNWLLHVPHNSAVEFTPNQYLLILRHYRLLLEALDQF